MPVDWMIEYFWGSIVDKGTAGIWYNFHIPVSTKVKLKMKINK